MHLASWRSDTGQRNRVQRVIVFHSPNQISKHLVDALAHFWLSTYSRYLGSEISVLTSTGQTAMKSGANHHVHHRIKWNNYNPVTKSSHSFSFSDYLLNNHITVIAFLFVATILFCCVLVSKCGLCRILPMATLI